MDDTEQILKLNIESDKTTDPSKRCQRLSMRGYDTLTNCGMGYEMKDTKNSSPIFTRKLPVM
jgi:meiotically up-regulated gene 157 (Mug157) protein